VSTVASPHAQQLRLSRIATHALDLGLQLSAGQRALPEDLERGALLEIGRHALTYPSGGQNILKIGFRRHVLVRPDPMTPVHSSMARWCRTRSSKLMGSS